jgi:hypothetical protein
MIKKRIYNLKKIVVTFVFFSQFLVCKIESKSEYITVASASINGNSSSSSSLNASSRIEIYSGTISGGKTKSESKSYCKDSGSSDSSSNVKSFSHRSRIASCDVEVLHKEKSKIDKVRERIEAIDAVSQKSKNYRSINKSNSDSSVPLITNETRDLEKFQDRLLQIQAEKIPDRIRCDAEKCLKELESARNQAAYQQRIFDNRYEIARIFEAAGLIKQDDNFKPEYGFFPRGLGFALYGPSNAQIAVGDGLKIVAYGSAVATIAHGRSSSNEKPIKDVEKVNSSSKSIRQAVSNAKNRYENENGRQPYISSRDRADKVYTHQELKELRQLGFEGKILSYDGEGKSYFDETESINRNGSYTIRESFGWMNYSEINPWINGVNPNDKKSAGSNTKADERQFTKVIKPESNALKNSPSKDTRIITDTNKKKESEKLENIPNIADGKLSGFMPEKKNEISDNKLIIPAPKAPYAEHLETKNSQTSEKKSEVLSEIHAFRKNEEAINPLIKILNEQKTKTEVALNAWKARREFDDDDYSSSVSSDESYQEFQNQKSDKIEKDKNEDAQAPGIPTEKDGFIPPKNWDGKMVKHPKNGKKGWADKKGNIWVPTGPGAEAHGGPHWDVQHPNGKNYDNVYPGGKIRTGK